MNSVFRPVATFFDFERVRDGVHLYFGYDSHLLILIINVYDSHGPIQLFTILDAFSKSESCIPCLLERA